MLRMLGGKPILARIIERLEPQVAAMVINANGDPSRPPRSVFRLWPTRFPVSLDRSPASKLVSNGSSRTIPASAMP
jgi:molybdopterin-guanine dinucleotide biosynthesis protein A